MKLGYRVVGVVSLSLLVPGWAVAGEGSRAGAAQAGAAVAGATGSGVSKGKVRKSDTLHRCYIGNVVPHIENFLRAQAILIHILF